MTRYCGIHGAIEVPDGPPNQIFKCPAELDQKPCNTVLELAPRSSTAAYATSQPQDATAPTRAKRHDTIINQAAFLAAYGKLGSITEASKVADIDRKRHYEWLVNDPEYEKLFEEAHRSAVQNLVDAAYARAMGLGIEASDRLMIKFLESIPPGMSPRGWQFNAPKRHEVSGPGGAPIEANVSARDALSSRIASLTTTTDPPSGS